MLASQKNFKLRIRVLLTLIILLLLCLFIRLWHLQITLGPKYRKYADENRIRIIPLPPSRGVIYDRQGRILANNKLKFCLSITPTALKSNTNLLKKLQNIFKINPSKIKNNPTKNSPFEPIILKEDLDIKAITTIEELNLPEVTITIEPIRYYPYEQIASHVLGYVREISPQELEILQNEGYKQGNKIGKEGVEKYYDHHLKGQPGGDEVEVDARGRIIRILGHKNPKHGDNITLTIDLNIQKSCETALTNKTGAIVVTNPQTGEILAMASSPSFNPNKLSGKLEPKEWTKLRYNKSFPLQNRAIKSSYQPGSIFKIITALSALQENKVTPQSHFYCPGVFKAGSRHFHCWAKHGHINFMKGIYQSCNVMFYQLGKNVGRDKLINVAESFGLGKPMGIELDNEKSGIIPDEKFRKKHKLKYWYPGDTLNLSIGQGFITVTPLQAACLLSAIANGGKLLRPALIKEIRDSDGNTVYSFTPKIIRKDLINNQHLEIIKQGLRDVVAQGTARAANSTLIEIAGKTGTVQNPHGKPHAWFAGFAPLSEPQMVVVVLIEHGGTGGATAAPIAKKIFESTIAAPKSEEAKKLF